jgi:hypothetical protein
MKIKSLDELKFDTDKQMYNLFVPQFVFLPSILYYEYEVQKTEDMRIDLVMLSIYNEDESVLENTDIILYINGIDNPLNIKEGMKILYVSINDFDLLRIYLLNQGEDVKSKIAIPNKTTRKDDSRKKYIESGYSLPPVVLEKPQQPVRLSDGDILIGGIN